MSNFIADIQNQPHRTRLVFMWLFLVASFTIVLLIWYLTTRAQVVGLVNPARTRQQAIAMANTGRSSGLATIGLGWSSFLGNLNVALGGKPNEITIYQEPTPIKHPFPIAPRTLPVSRSTE